MKVIQAIDWVGATFRHDALVLFGGHSFDIEARPHHGYTMAWKNEDGAIMMINPDRHDMGRHVIFSGTALTNYRAMGYADADILQWFEAAKITRLDLAIDVYDAPAPFDVLAYSIENKTVQTSARVSSRIKTLTGRGDTLYIGKRPGSVMRIYDKGAQTETGLQWDRIEVEFKHEKAQHAAALLLASGCADYRPLINGFARFIGVEWWDNVMGAELQGVKATRRESDTWLWLIKTCAPSLAREVQANPDKLHKFIAHVIDLTNEGSHGGIGTTDNGDTSSS